MGQVDLSDTTSRSFGRRNTTGTRRTALAAAVVPSASRASATHLGGTDRFLDWKICVCMSYTPQVTIGKE